MPMETPGYASLADNPRRDRLFFVCGLPRYSAPANSRLTPHASRGDRSLATQYKDDRDADIVGTEAYVEDIMAKARLAPLNHWTGQVSD